MPGDVRFVAPIDTLASSVGLAYMQNRARYFGADDFFPFVPFDGYNGSIFVEEALSNLTAPNALAGDETGYKTVSFRGKAIPFMAEDFGFQSLVTWRQLNSTKAPGMPLTARRQRSLTEKVWLAREIRAQVIVDAITPDTSLSGAFKWNATSSPTPAPRTDIMAGKKKVLQFTGREPNKVAMTGTVTDDLITRESNLSAGALLKDAIKYVMQATGRQINEPLIAAYFDVEMVRFLKGVKGTAAPTGTVEGALATQGSYIWPADEVYIWYGESDPGAETSSFGLSPGVLNYGAASFPDSMRRGIWVQAFQALIELTAEAKSMYVLGTVL